MPKTITVTSLANAGAGTLRAAIAQAQSGDTIKFSSALANKTITLAGSEIEIAAGKTLTIDGSNASNLTISGNSASRIFHLKSTSATPSKLVVKNLTLADGYTSERGGAISTTHQGELVIDNVTFRNNVADQGGGAIFTAFEGTLSVTHSSFRGNKAIAGNDERGAGAIAFWGPRDITIKHSDFINNQGINGGAINSLNGNLTIEQSRFINNRTITATYDSGNQITFLRGYGGAIYTDRASTSSDATSGAVRIVGSLFQGNQGRGEGGAAYLYTGTQDRVVIDSSTFVDNAIQNLPQGNDGNGGAVVVMSNGLNRGLTINRSTFANNSATNQGGGLWMMDARANITNSTFSGNRVSGTASNKVGGGMALYGPTNIINTTIANNRAGWVGGGISASKDDSVTLKNTILYNNTADNGTNDWGIQQHTSRELIDRGGNLQWPPKQTNNWNDYNATANIRLSDPQLGSLQDNGSGLLTHALLPGSPAINSGAKSGSPSVDQRGATRDSAPDSGAVEFGVEVPETGQGSIPVPIDDAPSENPSAPPVIDPTPSDRLVGTDGRDRLIGTGAADKILGRGGRDLLKGKGGKDVLKGGSGKDRLLGMGGKDKLIGQAGNDILIGGRGNDILKGGRGKDRYVFKNPKDGVDKIRGFEIEGDRLDLSAIFKGRAFQSRKPLVDYVELTQRGSRTVVSVDANGDRQSGGFRNLAVLLGTDASDLSAKNFRV